MAGPSASPAATLRILMSGPRDTRMMVVYGYARLVGYDRNYDLVPDILKSLDVKDDRIFTLHLRKGMKWSDGAPFTAEDFRYFWEDMASNRKVSPAGAPREMMVDGEPGQVRRHRRDDRPLRMGEAQPRVPAGAGRGRRRSTSTSRRTT